MERRNFIRLGVAGVGIGILAPTMAQADNGKQTVTGNIYYTKDAQGVGARKLKLTCLTLKYKSQEEASL